MRGAGTSKKDKLYDGNNAINQRVTSILALYDDITGLPSYNDMRMLSYNLSFSGHGWVDLNCMIAILLLYDSNS